MRIAILGTFVLDEIYGLDKSKTESLGGISYSLAILSNLLNDEDTIIPIANMGEDGYGKITTYFSNKKNIDFSALNVAAKNNTRVRLYYQDKENRVEFLSHKLPPIALEQVMAVGDIDVLLLNFITGFELTLDTFHEIGRQANALTYMDFHSLSLGINDDGKRFIKKPSDWKRWMNSIDILQFNEFEAALLKEKEDDFKTFGQQLIHAGARVVNVTLGSKGSVVTHRKNEKIVSNEIQSFIYGKSLDVTGCGDAFAGGFIVEYVKSVDPIRSAINANRIAGFNSTLKGIEQIHRLSHFLKNDQDLLYFEE
ncbi:MAG: carbohydrate kinase family protein [candidate division KSB1 bacterium]|jgi:sugar/nucleoside kinase (ribokinase family)|nr:carbohydrate kinase family protein [candidate division KSB1 bacterium]